MKTHIRFGPSENALINHGWHANEARQWAWMAKHKDNAKDKHHCRETARHYASLSRLSLENYRLYKGFL